MQTDNEVPTEVQTQLSVTRFRAPVATHRRDGSGGARSVAYLEISPGKIVLQPTPRLRRVDPAARPIVHEAPDVTLVYSRLLPPWMDTHMIVHDADSVALAHLGRGARRRLVEALRSCGFTPKEWRTWFATGSAGFVRGPDQPVW